MTRYVSEQRDGMQTIEFSTGERQRNEHVHPTMQAVLRPFCISMHTDKGERGFRMEAPDAVTATKEGIARLNIRDEEILPAGLCVRVEPTA